MVDSLLDPLVSHDNDIKHDLDSFKLILVRQYAPGSMRHDVLKVLKTIDLQSMGLKVKLEDLASDDNQSLDEMTLRVSRIDSEPFVHDDLLGILEELMTELDMFTPTVVLDEDSSGDNGK